MKHYYAIFKETNEAIEVEFPDLQGCFTFGKDWEEALENAEDALATWLVNSEPQFIKEPSKHNELEHLSDGKLIPILLNENILAFYRKLKRFNVIFPADMLRKVDKFRKIEGLKRSTFLQKAAEAYIQQHEARG